MDVITNEEQNTSQRKPQGLLKSYHGIVYQIQWIMIVALQARKARNQVENGFTFRTEENEKDVGKFDDVVWQYRDGLEKKYNFLQCKHKLNPKEKITMNELCKKAQQNNNPFSLQKYFISYNDHIKQSPKYRDGLIENLILATNIDINDCIKNNFKGVHIRNINPVLKVEKRTFNTEVYTKCWKIDSSCVHQDIISILEETYDLIKLVKVLEEFIRNQLTFQLPNNLKVYSKALYDNILDPEENRLSDNFVSGSNLSKQAEFLREAFFQELFVKQRKSLSLTHDYNLTKPAEFASAFACSLKTSKDKNVVIHRGETIIEKNIDKLAGYVLIKEDGIKFNYKFWTTCGKDLPNKSLHIFRTSLTEKLQQFGYLNTDDSQTTIANKLNSYRFIITRFVTCRKELVDEYSFWKSAKRYNGFENFCNTTNLFLEARDLPNYSLNDIKNNITHFFDLLVFAVGYSRKYLSQVIQYDLEADFGCINNEFMADAFRSQIAKSLDLVEDRFISTTEEVVSFFTRAQQQINRFILIGPTLEYRIRSFLHNIKFSKNTKDKIKLRPFLIKSSTEQVLSIIAVHRKLSSIKVHQILESIPEYKFKNQSNAYIFMCSSTVFCLSELVIQNFEFYCNLLVVECDMTTKSGDEEYLCSEICRIISRNSNKKVVLVGEENNCLAETFKKRLGVKYTEVFDKRNNFLNLTKSSQDNILSETDVVFQGQHIKLQSLLVDNIKYLVNAESLYKVISGEEIEIGVGESFDLCKVKDYYINRTFCRQETLEKEVLKENDMFAISNTDKFELSEEISKLFGQKDRKVGVNIKIRHFDEEDPSKNNPIKFIILNNEHARNQFMILCQNYHHLNIHWLSKDNDFFIWQGSHGRISNLQIYLRKDTKEYKQVQNQFINAIKLKKVTIVSAEPGMGKSTAMTDLESLLTSDPSLWVVRINLLHFSTDLKHSLLNIDESFVIHFIYKAAKLHYLTNKENSSYLKKIDVTVSIKEGKFIFRGQTKNLKSLELLEIGIFNHCYNHGRVVLLFDGYDEICSAYEEKVIQIFKILYTTSVAHIFITTRPYNILNNLENTMTEFSYTLKPFDYEEQIFFLVLYWKANLNLTQLNENRANVFIDELLQRFSEATSDDEGKFVSIPLQLRMLADIFQDDFEEFYNSNVKSLNEVYRTRMKDKLNLINLYDEFVKIKFKKIRFKEKKPGSNNDDSDMLEIIKDVHKKFINDHQKLSVYALFHDSPHKVLDVTEIEEVINLINLLKLSNDKNGIISSVSNNIPIFVHRTFAEYFASCYLWEKFKTTQYKNFAKNYLDDLILNNIFTGKYVQICRFFYFTAEKDFKENVSFSHMDDKIVALLEKMVNIITSLYNIYRSIGANEQKGTDDIHDYCRRETYTQEYFNTEYFRDANYVPCIKLLFKIIECYMSGKEPHSDAISAIITKDQTLHLLRMSGEIGCLYFAKCFVHTNKRDYKEDLLMNKWYFTPLWLAAKNQHLEVLRLLSNIYDCNWTDKDRQNLVQRVYNRNEMIILRSCLLANITDGSPYTDLNGYLRLPLVTALENRYPSDIIKMLMAKSNVNLINEFAGYDIPAPYEMSTGLLQYDSEITQLAITHGINFSGVVNLLLYEFQKATLTHPIIYIDFPHFSKSSFFTDEEFLNLNSTIETLLLSGVGFNTKDPYENTTTQYSAQIHFVHELLSRLLKVDKPLETLHKLIIKCLRDKGFYCDFNKCHSQIVMINNKNNEDLWLIPDRLHQLHKEIRLQSYTTLGSCLYNLRLYLEEAKEEINYFKTYKDNNTFNRILTGYEEMLEYDFRYETHKTKLYKSLKGSKKKLLSRVLILYIRQDYDIKAAFKEVATEVLKVKVLTMWMIKQRNSQNIITDEELLLVLDLEDINTNVELQDLTCNIYNSGGIELLHRTWSSLYDTGRKNVSGILNIMTKFSNVSTKNYRLMNDLKTTYETITVAIKNRNFSDITSILQSVDSRYVRSIVNAQDDEYGSPLHYAVYTNDLDLTRVFLSHGANPNYKLQAHGNLLSFSEDFNEGKHNDIQEDYKSYTALHLAVIKSNTDIIQLLRDYGADHSIKNKENKNSLLLAEEKLAMDKEKYEKIREILESEPNFKTYHQVKTISDDTIKITTAQGSYNKRKRKAQGGDSKIMEKKRTSESPRGLDS